LNKTKSVLIPVPLVKNIIELLGCWDISNYDRVIRDNHSDVLHLLNIKMQKLELRCAYSKIVAADNEDRRHDARMEYLLHKKHIDNLSSNG
jgi:hypothetical protein